VSRGALAAAVHRVLVYSARIADAGLDRAHCQRLGLPVQTGTSAVHAQEQWLLLSNIFKGATGLLYSFLSPKPQHAWTLH
jgi:hypothetical protein